MWSATCRPVWGLLSYLVLEFSGQHAAEEGIERGRIMNVLDGNIWNCFVVEHSFCSRGLLFVYCLWNFSKSLNMVRGIT